MLRPFEMQSRACISSPAVNRGLRVLEPSFFDSKSIRLSPPAQLPASNLAGSGATVITDVIAINL